MSGGRIVGTQEGTRSDWGTPSDFFIRLDEEFHFTLDAAASAENAKVPRYLSRLDDALSRPWDGTVFVNPPYGQHSLPRWLAKAFRESRRGATVVLLVPARTDARWWHEWASRASEIRFVRGRLWFVGAPWTCPFPSVVLVFRPPAISSVDATPRAAAARTLFDVDGP